MESAIDSAVSKVALETFEAEGREAIAAFVSGNDVFVSLPTGYGKSFYYVLLPLVFDELLQRSGLNLIYVTPRKRRQQEIVYV